MKLLLLSSILAVSIVRFMACGQQETERRSDYVVEGIDVSHYQSHIYWDSIAAQGIDFVFVKASEGELYRDSLFVANWNAIGQSGLLRGAYHFFHPSLDARKQANNFIASVPFASGDLPPVLDFETVNGLSKKQVVRALKSWLKIVGDAYDVQPILYTNMKLYEKYISGDFHGYKIWIARYNDETPLLNDGRPWHFWQYGNKGRLKGIEGDVDFNVYNGSLEALKELCIYYKPDSVVAKPRPRPL